MIAWLVLAVATGLNVLAQEGEPHWAFQAPQISQAPEVEDVSWPQCEIDAFILDSLEKNGLQPVRDASRATLVRRLYFDLIGLPPSPQEACTFIEDDSPNAIATLVDRLLASPGFGERWGRHWLDVVRFAESSGREFNFTYPHAWPFRDYVINALNADKPYTQFICEQVAGDLMPVPPEESIEEREARLIATSMLSFGTKRHNAGGMGYRMEIVDDQIDVTCRAIMGLTVACAKCHDHKFDPIPTKDYYALAGIFLSTEPLYGTIKQKYSNNPTDLLPIGSNAAEQHAAAEAYEEKVIAAKKSRDDKKAELEKAEKPDNDEAKPDEETIANLKAELATFEEALKELEKNRPPRPAYAMSARDRPEPADTKVAIRGDIGNPGELAPRGFLTTFAIPEVPTIDSKQSGRLQLAQWLTSHKNPLSARVMVNRIWHHLFGRGLVESVDNFGLTGTTPTHQELLDSLAVEFMEDGWSIKDTIRKIVLSRTYQLSCAACVENEQVDPENRLLWRSTPRRLPVEMIRDAILAVSGELKLDRPSGSPVTALGDQLVRGVDTKKLQPPSSHRSVYLPVVRDYAPEMFDRFDFPSSSLVSGKRAVTNVPSQALFLRNSEFVATQAEHAAKRLLANKSVTTDADRIDLALRWAFARPATLEESEAALHLLEAATGEVKAWTALFLSLYSTAEFRYLVDIEEKGDPS